MIKIGLVFAFLFAISSQTNAQKEVHHTSDTIPVYLPLQLGNKWQYLEVSQPGFSVASYSLSFAEVESDTLINNLLYYRLSDFGDLVRYSVIEKKYMFIRMRLMEFILIFQSQTGLITKVFLWDSIERFLLTQDPLIYLT